MAAGHWTQFVQLFLKAFWIKRRRRPVVMLLEIVWPAFLFSIVIAVRSGSPPVQKYGCYYNARAMPSAGAIDFIQTHICGINNRCLKEEPMPKPWMDTNTSTEVVHSTQGGASKDTASSLPSFSLTGTAGEADKVLPVLPKILSLIEQLKQTLSKPGVGDYIRGDQDLSLGLLSRDSEVVRAYLVNNSVVPEDLADKFINASIQFGGDSLIPELKEIFDLKAFVCDGETLGEILKAPNGYQQTIEELSNELCMLNHNMVPVLTEAITGNINSTGVIQYVKTTLEEASKYTQDNLFSDLQIVLTGLRDMKTLEPVFEGIPPLKNLPEILGNVQGLLKRTDNKASVSSIMSHVGPLIGNVLDDEQLGDDVVDLTEGIETISNFIRKATKGKEFFFGNLLDNLFLAQTSLEQLLGIKVGALLNSQIDSFQLREIASQTTLGNDFQKLTCDNPRLSRVLKNPSRDARDIIDGICDLDDDVIDARIRPLFNYPAMLLRADQSQRNTIGFLDWIGLGASTFKTVSASVSLGRRISGVVKSFKDKTSNLGKVLEEAFSEPFEISDSVEVGITDGLDIVSNIIGRVPELKGLASGVHFTRQIVESSNNDFIEIKSVVKNPLALVSIIAGNPVILERILDAFISSSVDINKLFGLTADGDNTNLVTSVCAGSSLTSLFKIPDIPGISLDDVTDTLCGEGRGELNNVLKELDSNKIIASTISKILPSYMMYGDWWDRSIDDVLGIIDGIGTVMDIASGDRVFDARVFLKLFYHFIANMGVEGRADLAKGMPSIFKIISDRVKEPEYFASDIAQFADKLLKLSIFYREIPLQGTLREFLKEPTELQAFLKDTLELTAPVANAIVNSQFNTKLIYNISQVEFAGRICGQSVISDLIDTSKFTVGELSRVTDSICALSQKDLMKVTDLLVPELEVGGLLQGLLDLSPTYLLQSNNLTREETMLFVENLAPLQKSFNSLLESVKDISEQTTPNKSTSSGSGGVLEMTKTYGKAICGTEKAFDFGDYGISILVSEEERDETVPEPVWTKRQLREMDEFNSSFCVNIYRAVHSIPGLGNFMWTFLKPLTRGIVLYSPKNAATDAIMQEAWWLFDSIEGLRDMTKEWESLKGSLEAVSGNATSALNLSSADTLDIVKAITRPVISSTIKQTTGFSGPEIITKLPNLKAIPKEDLDRLDVLAELIYNISTCLNFTLKGVKDETELDVLATELMHDDQLLAGISFKNFEDWKPPKKGAKPTLPKHITYHIRMGVDHVVIPDGLFDKVRTPGPLDDYLDNYRYMRSFLPLQDLIDHAIIKLHTGGKATLPSIYTQAFPYPCYQIDDFMTWSSFVIVIILLFSWLCMMAVGITNAVSEKESGVEDTMTVMGMKGGVNRVAWFTNTFLGMIFLSAFVTMLISLGNLIRFSDYSLIFAWLVSYSWSIVMLCYFVSAIIHRTNLAALFGLLLYIILCMPFIILHTMDIVFSLSQKNKILMSLSVTSAFCFGANELITFEQNGHGITWSTAFIPIGETFPFAWSCIMTVVDGVIYGIIAWYISNKFPGVHGLPQPWYFPLSPVYWGLKKSSALTELKFTDPEKLKKPSNGISITDWINRRRSKMVPASFGAPGEAEPNNLPIGISMHDMSKVYKDGKKTAVDGLSVNFYEGQITAFLGHNGAGKSTCIHMLTGLIQPSGGTAYIGGININGGFAEIRKSLGYCPQHDVLFDYMNIQEHFHFYSRLKGMSKVSDAKQEVQRMLELTDLAPFKHVPVNQLSGGQRRRVSVGMSFIGGSKVIILDEPTSGVDPAARRKIWEIIVKHRENRTIVLCTHHLDEADILGDRIVIIHQGRLVCSGSSLWLKTQYGSGYHLTISKYIEGIKGEKHKHHRHKGRVWKTKKVLQFIKSFVPRARIVEEIGTEITIVLPTNRGQSKRFQSLFIKLDARREALAIDKYGIADSTLEEVFLKVTKRAEQGKSLNPDRLRAWVLKGSGDSASLAESMAESAISEDDQGSTGTDGVSLAASDATSAERPSSTSETITTSRSSRSTNRSTSAFSRSSHSSAGSNSSNVTTSDATSLSSGNSSATSFKSGKDDDTLLDIDAGNLTSSRRISGVSLKLLQFKALLIKRFHHHRRDFRSHVSQVVLPAIFVMIAMFSGLFRPKIGYTAPYQLDSSIYGPETEMFYSIDKPSILAKEMERTFLHTPSIGTACMPGNPRSKEIDCQDIIGFREPVVGADLERVYENPPDCECDFGSQTCPIGAAGRPPPRLRTSTNDYMVNLTAHQLNISQYTLKTFNQFANYDTGGHFGGWTFDMKSLKTTATLWYNNKGIHSQPAFYNALNNMILRANIHMNGPTPADSNPEEYGITVYNHPLNATAWPLSRNGLLASFSDTGVALTILIAYCFVPASYIVYVINERIRQEKRLQFICGVGTTLYWFNALLWDMMSYCLTVSLTIIIAASFNQPVYTYGHNLMALTAMLVLFGWSTIPLMYLLSRWFTNPTVGYVAAFIINLCIGINTTACIFFLSTPIFNGLTYIVLARTILTRAFLVFPQFCLGDSLVKLAYNQIITNILKGLGVDMYVSPFSKDMLFYHFLTMGVEGALFFGLHLIVEFKICSSRKKAKRPADYREDGDVGLERQRVVTGDANNDLLTLYNLTKFYRRRFQKILAVDNLCIGVPRGECFGLLGVNGAGKTTSFKMITGEIRPSSGAAILNQRVISEDVAYMDQNVGYCPQFDALDDYLTGKEMVYYYSRLKGIPEREIPPILHSITGKFKLEQHIGNTVRTYSAGNKRKLSTALALLGDPDLVLLDEPTTGMDPGTRRLVWNNILKVIKDKRSVILTSHSMEECDALCTRMAIMVNGNFMCLGSSQHLKDKFGTGYTVTTRIGGQKPNLRRVKDFMRRNFPGTRLKDQHLNNLEFGVPSRACTLAVLFGRLEQEKRHLKIENYSVSQTTLDQVFLSFARLQGDGRVQVNTKNRDSFDNFSEASETPETSSIADSIGTAGSLHWSEPPTERGAPPSYHTGGIAPNPYDNQRILPALDNVTALHIGPDSEITVHNPPPGVSVGSLSIDSPDFIEELEADFEHDVSDAISGTASSSTHSSAGTSRTGSRADSQA